MDSRGRGNGFLLAQGRLFMREQVGSLRTLGHTMGHMSTLDDMAEGTEETPYSKLTKRLIYATGVEEMMFRRVEYHVSATPLPRH